MKFVWNEAKAAENLRKHKVSFNEAYRFEFDDALIGIDDDLAYGEERMKAYGFVGRLLHVMVYVERADVIRVISLRTASKPEVRKYGEYIARGW